MKGNMEKLVSHVLQTNLWMFELFAEPWFFNIGAKWALFVVKNLPLFSANDLNIREIIFRLPDISLNFSHGMQQISEPVGT